MVWVRHTAAIQHQFLIQQLLGRSVMKRNLGGKDHTVRLMMASAGVAIGLFAKRGWIKALGFSIGGAELAAAISRYSPLNQVLGRNTAR